MTNSPDDPLSRALAHIALAREQSAAVPPVVVEALKRTTDALLEALEERKALLSVANAAMTLIEALDDHEEAIEKDDAEKVIAAGETGSKAEDALVDALHALVATDASRSADAAYLAALNQFTHDKDTPK
jgi:diphthamide biosynthesis methyltransferase